MYFTDTDIQKFLKVELQLIKTQQEGNLFTITLNRAEKRNAFQPFGEALPRASPWTSRNPVKRD